MSAERTPETGTSQDPGLPFISRELTEAVIDETSKDPALLDHLWERLSMRNAALRDAVTIVAVKHEPRNLAEARQAIIDSVGITLLILEREANVKRLHGSLNMHDEIDASEALTEPKTPFDKKVTEAIIAPQDGVDVASGGKIRHRMRKGARLSGIMAACLLFRQRGPGNRGGYADPGL